MRKIYILLVLQIIWMTSVAQCPSVTVTPITQTVTCGGPILTFTAFFTPTTNVAGVWIGPGNSLVNVSLSTPVTLQTSNPGTYTFMATNLTSSCVTAQTVTAVRQMTIIPLMTVTASNGFTLSCSTPSTVLQVNSTSILAPTTYSWTNITTSVTSYVANGSYTVTTPGYYMATFSDGNMCPISQMVEVISTCTSIHELSGNSDVSLFPNPNHGSFNIELNKPVENAELRIFNCLGLEVQRDMLSGKRSAIDIKDVNAGIYYYTISKNKQVFANGKLLVE